MHVPAVGSRSSSLAIWTLWMEMSGLRHLNPNRGGRLQDVMKRRSPARSSAENSATTSQNHAMMGCDGW